MDFEKIEKLYIRLNALNEVLLPQAQNASGTIHDDSWRTFNQELVQLSQITGDDYYSDLAVSQDQYGGYILATDFSSAVYRAAQYLYKTQEDNLDIHPPRSPSGNWSGGAAVSQTVNTNQTTEINIEFNQTLSYISESIGAAKAKYEAGTNERKFLDKVKAAVSATKTSAEILKMIVSLAAELGISADTLKDMFQ